MAVEQTEVDPAKVDELMGRLIQDFAGAGSIPLTMIGISTGLWKAMAGAGPLTPAEVAQRSGTAERYVAEWLKAQAAGGYVTYHPESGRFSLPAEAAAVLADDGGDRLRSGARVADVGCGYGAPTIVMAQTYPASRFWGFDYHDALIARVGRQHPALGRHLTDTVSTGTWCAYTPPTPVDWEL
jgi:hypothetical protein